MRFLLHQRLVPSTTTTTLTASAISSAISPQLPLTNGAMGQQPTSLPHAHLSMAATNTSISHQGYDKTGVDQLTNKNRYHSLKTSSNPPTLASRLIDTNLPMSNNVAIPVIRAWGQQCSEHCGCAIRFEMTMDPSTHVITSAHYTAKQLVGSKRQPKQPQNISLSSPYFKSSCQSNKSTTTTITNNSNSWNPHFTFGSTNQDRRRPLVASCSCSTLQQLAHQVTMYLPHHTLDQIRNELEFTMPRSSLAVSHTILRQQQLPVTNTHCWDVLEEALTAMVKGYLPRPRTTIPAVRRRRPQSPDAPPLPHFEGDDDDDPEWVEPASQRMSSSQQQQQLEKRYPTSALDVYYYDDKNQNNQGEHPIHAYPFAMENHRHRHDSSSSSSSSSSSLDMIYSMSPSLQHQIHNIQRPQSSSNYSSSYYDWVTYVDELRHQEEERSA